jgi:hypothetical protein
MVLALQAQIRDGKSAPEAAARRAPARLPEAAPEPAAPPPPPSASAPVHPGKAPPAEIKVEKEW